MEKSKVYFTSFKATFSENLMQKLERLIKTAGMGNIDFKDKYAAIKSILESTEILRSCVRITQRWWETWSKNLGESLFSLTAIPSMWDHGKMLWIIWTMLTGTALPLCHRLPGAHCRRTERNGRSDRAHRRRACERSKNRPRINGRGYSDLPDTF